MSIYEHSKHFPSEEMYSMIDQARRASRSVSANIAEAWRKRRYPASFVSKLTDAEAEAAECQVWLEYAVKCGYIKRTDAAVLYRECERLISTIVHMITHHSQWTLPKRPVAQPQP